MTILEVALAVLGKALDLFSTAGGAAKLHAWLTKSVDELDAIKRSIEPPPPPK